MTAYGHCWRRTDTYDELDLDWRIDRQRRNAYGASRMPPRVAKDLYQHSLAPFPISDWSVKSGALAM